MKLQQFSKNLMTDGVSLQTDRRSDSRSTFASTSTSTTTALTILLLSSQAMAVRLPSTPIVEVRITNRPSGQTIVSNEGVSPHSLMSALIQFHDRIVASQEDLPPEAAKVLYSNLWELYG